MAMVVESATALDSGYRPLRAGKRLVDSARISGNKLYLSGDVYERLGHPRFVSIQVSVSRAAFAVRPAVRNPTSDVMKVNRVTGGTVAISSVGALAALRRCVSPAAPTAYLPHRWVGDVLIVDVSAMSVIGED